MTDFVLSMQDSAQHLNYPYQKLLNEHHSPYSKCTKNQAPVWDEYQDSRLMDNEPEEAEPNVSPSMELAPELWNLQEANPSTHAQLKASTPQRSSPQKFTPSREKSSAKKVTALHTPEDISRKNHSSSKSPKKQVLPAQIRSEIERLCREHQQALEEETIRFQEEKERLMSEEIELFSTLQKLEHESTELHSGLESAIEEGQEEIQSFKAEQSSIHERMKDAIDVSAELIDSVLQEGSKQRESIREELFITKCICHKLQFAFEGRFHNVEISSLYETYKFSPVDAWDDIILHYLNKAAEPYEKQKHSLHSPLQYHTVYHSNRQFVRL